MNLYVVEARTSPILLPALGLCSAGVSNRIKTGYTLFRLHFLDWFLRYTFFRLFFPFLYIFGTVVFICFSTFLRLFFRPHWVVVLVRADLEHFI